MISIYLICEWILYFIQLVNPISCEPSTTFCMLMTNLEFLRFLRGQCKKDSFVLSISRLVKFHDEWDECMNYPYTLQQLLLLLKVYNQN